MKIWISIKVFLQNKKLGIYSQVEEKVEEDHSPKMHYIRLWSLIFVGQKKYNIIFEF